MKTSARIILAILAIFCLATLTACLTANTPTIIENNPVPLADYAVPPPGDQPTTSGNDYATPPGENPTMPSGNDYATPPDTQPSSSNPSSTPVTPTTNPTPSSKPTQPPAEPETPSEPTETPPETKPTTNPETTASPESDQQSGQRPDQPSDQQSGQDPDQPSDQQSGQDPEQSSEPDLPNLTRELEIPLEEDEIWVLIDLSDQHLWLYQYDQVLVETGVVTGHATKHPTRIGEFALKYKVRNRTLKGPGYSCFVKYWMPFDGGIGLHDASWRKAEQFGTDTYLTNGSHGCVNMPSDKAKEVYDLVQKGTRIVVQE